MNLEVIVKEMRKAEGRVFKDRFVAFIDILGYANKMKELKTVEEWCIYSAILKGYCAEKHDKFKTYLFTDCIYIVCEHDGREDMLDFIARLSRELLCFGTIKLQEKIGKTNHIISQYLMVRGGITYGSVYCASDYKDGDGADSNIFLGPAILQSYFLESQKAVYPWIVLDKDAVGQFKEDDLKELGIIYEKSKELGYFDFLKYIDGQIAKGNEHYGKSDLDMTVPYEKIREEAGLDKYGEDVHKKLEYMADYLKKYTPYI